MLFKRFKDPKPGDAVTVLVISVRKYADGAFYLND
jgi:hypothetical protein